MSKPKRYSNFVLLIVVSLFIVVLGCKKDEQRTTILGSWNCEEFSDIGQRNYQVSITRNYMQNEANEYIINNFHNIGLTESTEVYVREIDKGELTITGTAAIDMSFTGKGVIASDFSRIEWVFKVNNNPNIRANYY